MMKKTLLLLLLFFISSYSQSKKANITNNFDDKIVDFSIKNCENKFIELPDLYSSLAQKIPTEENEKLVLAEKLKKRGFKVINWGRGNHTLGPRIIFVTLKKDDCMCDVVKIYYSTANEFEYQMTEKIKCKKKL